MDAALQPASCSGTVPRCLALLFLLLFAPVAAAQPADQKQILLLHYYGADSPGKAAFDPAFAGTLRTESAYSVALHSEILETYRFTGEAHERIVADYLRQKYAGFRIDVIVALFDPALAFVLRHRDDLFKGVPVVAVVIREPSAATRQLGVAGMLQAPSHIRDTIEIAMTLQPTLRHLVVVDGVLDNSGSPEAETRKQFKGLEGRLSLEYLKDLALADVVARLKTVAPDSAVLYLRQTKRNQTETVDQIQGLSQIVGASPAPVYALNDPLLGHGIVGGYMMDFGGMGRELARIALRVANGTPPQDIAWVPAPAAPMFDWRALKRSGISERRLPQGSIVRYREPSIWDYKWIVFGALAFLLAQSAAIASLVVQRTRRRKAEEQVMLSESRRSLATSAGQVGVWDWNFQTNEIYVDPQLKQLLGYEDREIANHLDDWVQRVHPDDRPLFDSRARAHLDGAAPTFELEHRMLHKDGSVRWFLARGSATTHNGTRPTRLLGTSTDITERKRVQEELEASYRQIRGLAGRLIFEQETERARIARDLHDDASQELAALSIGLGMLRRRLVEDPASADTAVRSLQERAVVVGEQIRRFSHELHPGVLQRAGLVAALRAHCAEFGEQQGVEVDLRSDVDSNSITPTVAVCLYRVAQEAFHNIAKHAGAHRVAVVLNRTDSGIALAITDDGHGFDQGSAEHGKGLGLVSLDERVRLLGGTLTVESIPEHGTSIRAQIPLEGH
jgi:PAS domain S-box-containing protein